MTTTTMTAKPTVVLVHGAWANASSFDEVTEQLQQDGYTVVSAPNPLRGLASDAANVAAFVNQRTTGPVVLVGHSYGGSVISVAAVDTPTVTALVFINAYAPDEGETVIQLSANHPGSRLGVPDPSTVFDFVQYPGAPTGDVDTYIKLDLFREFFGARLGEAQAEVIASSQSPVTLSALMEPATVPAWKTISSYFFVGTSDEVLPSVTQLEMANRAGGVIVSKAADHLSMLEEPGEIVKLIEAAAGAKP